jgi:glycosyltransferase involved in cell wall biosynthesis
VSVAVTDRRVLLAAHQRLAVGGIGSIAGGLAAHVPRLAAAEAISVVVPSPHGAALSSLRVRGAAARLRYEQTALARQARHADLIHLCDLRPVLLSSTPFLITVHDIDFLDRPDSYQAAARGYKGAMLSAAIRKGPAAVICHSEYVRARLLERFPAIDEGRIRVIRPGVEIPAKAWSGASDPPCFVTVSTISPRKNHLGLLDAFRRARRRGLEAEWMVVGSALPGSSAIVEALRSEPGVHLLGRVDRGQLDALYRDALFVATPSATEGFGYSPLEAMAVGTPILASDGGALPEVIGDAGTILPADDVDAWAEALVMLAENAETRARLSAIGRRRAREFSWDRAAADVVDLYREVLAVDPTGVSDAG